LRCRDRFGVDPARESALPAGGDSALPPEESVVAAELGAAAMRVAPELAELGGVVVVADGRGRMLASWGDERTAGRGREQNLGPLYSWAEPSTGTTAVGTALATGPVAVRRHEHWCTAFQDWSCAAAAVRDPAGRPAGVLGISVWERPLPERAGRWLLRETAEVERRLAARPRGACVESTQALPCAAPAPTPPAGLPASRLVGTRAGRTVIVPVASVRVAAVEDGLVWLDTDDGRLRAVARGLDELERRLAPDGFLRVSRTALVNLERVRELVPAFRGAVWVVVDGLDTPVAVSRRRVPALREAFGI
ncbi:MAG TPA: LytTR family transcriptional regulator DNA-binding domain-containing protein, partial [Gaiellaceae bacterium]|nr:LytTR family transcriptional regulator DNA-binding domain-containing protein [Gaiellaceae bacterium]